MHDERGREEGRENRGFITQQQLVHEGFVPITDHMSPSHSRKMCTGFSILTGRSLLWDYLSGEKVSTEIRENYIRTQLGFC